MACTFDIDELFSSDACTWWGLYVDINVQISYAPIPCEHSQDTKPMLSQVNPLLTSAGVDQARRAGCISSWFQNGKCALAGGYAAVVLHIRVWWRGHILEHCSCPWFSFFSSHQLLTITLELAPHRREWRRKTSDEESTVSLHHGIRNTEPTHSRTRQ